MKLSMIGLAQATCSKNWDYCDIDRSKPGMFTWRRLHLIIKGEGVLVGSRQCKLGRGDTTACTTGGSEFVRENRPADLRRADVEGCRNSWSTRVWCVSALLPVPASSDGGGEEARRHWPEGWERISTYSNSACAFGAYSRWQGGCTPPLVCDNGSASVVAARPGTISTVD